MLPLALTTGRARLASLSFAAIALLAAPRLAVADEPQALTASAQLVLDANPACTSRADLVARVRARSPRVSFVDDAGTVKIVAQISAVQAGAVAGDVTFISPDTKPSTRHVLGQSCSEAADAVALIIAVTLDPTSVNRPGAAGVGADRSSGSSSDAALDAPERPTSVPKPPRSPAGSAAKAPAAQAANPTRSRVGNLASFGVQLAAQSFLGPAPEVMPGAAVYAIVRSERSSAWSPAALLGATHIWQSSLQEQGGKASFTLDAASFDACPLRLRLGVVQARPCGTVLIGRLSARGTDTLNAADQSKRPFWVVGGAAVATAELGWLLEASARLAVGANLVRDSFEFTPSVFHTVSAVSVAASVGVGLRWR